MTEFITIMLAINKLIIIITFFISICLMYNKLCIYVLTPLLMFFFPDNKIVSVILNNG